MGTHINAGIVFGASIKECPRIGGIVAGIKIRLLLIVF
jgi:hypothetical protein